MVTADTVMGLPSATPRLKDGAGQWPLANRVRPWMAAHERHGGHGCVFAKGHCPVPLDTCRAKTATEPTQAY